VAGPAEIVDDFAGSAPARLGVHEPMIAQGRHGTPSAGRATIASRGLQNLAEDPDRRR
jgi:hypothetical protein